MRKYAHYGAYIGLLLILVSLLNYATGKIWNLLSLITMIGGVLFFLIYVIFCFDKIKKTFTLRSFKYGGNTLAMSVILLIILSLINFIANRHSVRFDFTSGKQYSLSPQTQQILKNLDQNIQATAFYSSGSDQSVKDLFDSYRFYSNKFNYEIIDPDKKPAIAKQYGITSYGTMVFECEGRVETIINGGEQEVTNVLIKVTREEQKVVYFLDGHGENDVDDLERIGYNMAKNGIENENYIVRKLFLAEEKSIPDDCAILVMNGVQSRPFQSELDTIAAYLENGGKALFLLEPEPAYGFQDLLDKWGLKIGNDIVLDASGVGQLFGMGPSVPLVNNYTAHMITDNFNMMTFYPYARSVTPKEEYDSNLSVQALMRTSSNSWGETNLQDKEATFNSSMDLRGPITLGAVVLRDESEKKTRLVVIGDSEFANNLYYSAQGNGNLFMNIISWLAEEEDLIAIRAKEPEDRRLTLTSKQIQWLMYLTVILMPLAALGAGVGIYIKRERR
ncbi:GldG family protein [bacterium]|nr:GldG family protein [bacterium]